MSSLLERPSLDALTSERARRREQRITEGELDAIREEAYLLSRPGSLSRFMRAAWHVVEPSVELKWTWAIDAMAEHLEAVSDGTIRRLQIWIPPGSMKSRSVSILWPAWEWVAVNAGLRYFTGSYALPLSRRLTSKSRDLIVSRWFQARWRDRFAMTKLDETYYANDRGGNRLATAPGSTGSGEHGHRIVIDDPVNANDTEGLALAIPKANQWYDTTLSTRSADATSHAEVIVMQRLSDRDLAAHVLQYEPWTILCLPERYTKAHPYAYEGDRRDPSLPVRGVEQGEGALLWPARVGPKEHAIRRAKLGEHRARAQLQQDPSAREGNILKRAGWRYYAPEALERAELKDVSLMPKFRRVWSSWDTSFKEKTSSDFVCGGLWGAVGGDRYLLKVVHGHMGLGATLNAMTDLRAWGVTRWPRAAHTVLIEKSANGVEILEKISRDVTGVIPFVASTDKVSRAEAAEPDFRQSDDGKLVEGTGNVFVPGIESVTLGDYDPARTPAWVQQVIEECAVFPTPGVNDDRVDMVTMALNWIRTKPQGGSGKSYSAANRQVVVKGPKGRGRT